MIWKDLTRSEQLDEIKKASYEQPQVLFKHSTRCSISTVAKNRLDKEELPEGVVFYYLDLIANREISNQIAETFDVYHESPQVLVIKNGSCVYDESHSSINMEDITENF
jgi:bacillithiol system protein YtxJ